MLMPSKDKQSVQGRNKKRAEREIEEFEESAKEVEKTEEEGKKQFERENP
jgi:hypothetical protein